MGEKILRHIVLFKFTEQASKEKIDEIVNAFVGLKNKISFIKDIEWGTNNSPEGLDQGFTHCFAVAFESEKDRDAYLPHPEHKAFASSLKDYVEKVFVVDFWANH